MPRGHLRRPRISLPLGLYVQSRVALGLAHGIALAEYADLEEGETEPKRITYSANFACPVSGFTISEIEPRLFSFNNPFGACPTCDGLGTMLRFEADLVVPDDALTLRGGAILPWSRTGNTSPYYTQTLEAISKHYDVAMSTPWRAFFTIFATMGPRCGTASRLRAEICMSLAHIR